MTNKPLTLAVLAALSVAGGQANAATCHDMTIAALQGLGSCTFEDKIFSDFSFGNTVSR